MANNNDDTTDSTTSDQCDDLPTDSGVADDLGPLDNEAEESKESVEEVRERGDTITDAGIMEADRKKSISFDPVSRIGYASRNGVRQFLQERKDTALSVDSEIIAKQIKAEQEEDNNEQFGWYNEFDYHCTSGNADLILGDGIVGATFFGVPLSNYRGDTGLKWNPFRKTSGILGVIHKQSKKNRVVSKHGNINTFRRKDEARSDHRYLKDFFTSMIGMQWRWIYLFFAASFFVSWVGFAVIWYIIILVHGDLDENLPEDHMVCVDNVDGFSSAFLFSMELQHTIGFGGRATTPQCASGVILQCLQSIAGVIIQSCMAGVVFAKFTTPTNRGETIMFSKMALITIRNGYLYLVARVGDIRQNHLIGCQVYGEMVHHCTTKEGELVPYHLTRMQFGTDFDGEVDNFQMFWPMVISHKIDENSPLWELNPRDLPNKQFEIIITVEGSTPETSSTVQVRTSYLPHEILWGHRFEHTCVAYDKAAAKYAVSFSTINKFMPDRTPRCSAKELAERKKRGSRMSHYSIYSLDGIKSRLNSRVSHPSISVVQQNTPDAR